MKLDLIQIAAAVAASISELSQRVEEATGDIFSDVRKDLDELAAFKAETHRTGGIIALAHARQTIATAADYIRGKMDKAMERASEVWLSAHNHAETAVRPAIIHLVEASAATIAVARLEKLRAVWEWRSSWPQLSEEKLLKAGYEMLNFCDAPDSLGGMKMGSTRHEGWIYKTAFDEDTYAGLGRARNALRSLGYLTSLNPAALSVYAKALQEAVNAWQSKELAGAFEEGDMEVLSSFTERSIQQVDALRLKLEARETERNRREEAEARKREEDAAAAVEAERAYIRQTQSGPHYFDPWPARKPAAAIEEDAAQDDEDESPEVSPEMGAAA